jgi:hypothetical protein
MGVIFELSGEMGRQSTGSSNKPIVETFQVPAIAYSNRD